MSFLTGKSAKSSNKSYGYLKDSYSGSVSSGTNATNILSTLLSGSGSAEDTAAAQSGWENYKDNAGYSSALTDMTKGVTGSKAASGMLRSGSTSTALLNKGSEINNTYYNNYLSQLSNLSSLGLQAGSLISGAGQTSKGGSSGLLGSIASGVGAYLSDRRAKHDIELLDRAPDGLGLYKFRYLPEIDPAQEELQGVMADEVAEIRPWALGPVVDGYATVNYSRL